jgi:hypothetical protein
MGTSTEELKLEFEFSNTFISRDKNADCPVFLRHRGIQGSLRATNVVEGGLDKVKLVLRGKRCFLKGVAIILTLCRIFG